MTFPSHEESDEFPPQSALFDTVNTLVETHLAHIGPEQALGFLHILASALEKNDDNVHNFRGGVAGARAQRESRAWLRRSLTIWLARHG